MAKPESGIVTAEKPRLVGVEPLVVTPPPHTAAALRIPGDMPMPEGFSFFLVASILPTASFREIKLKPPSMMGGEKIDQTTMYNKKVRTAWAAKLIEFGDVTGSASYGPKVYSAADIRGALLNKNSGWTFYFEDGAYLDFWGTMNQFDPQDTGEKERPLANINIFFTNLDNAWNECEPVFVDAVGTP